MGKRVFPRLSLDAGSARDIWKKPYPEVGDAQGGGLEEPPWWVVAVAGVGNASSEPIAKEAWFH